MIKGKSECVREQNVSHLTDYMLRVLLTPTVPLSHSVLYLLLLLPWFGVRLNHSSCVYSLFLRLQNPTERQKEGKTNARDGKRAVRTPAYDSENWTTRWWKGENESPQSILLSRHHLGSLQVGTCGYSIRDLPPSSPWHRSPSTVCKNSAESNLTLSNGRRFEFPLGDTGNQLGNHNYLNAGNLDFIKC